MVSCFTAQRKKDSRFGSHPFKHDRLKMGISAKIDMLVTIEIPVNNRNFVTNC